MISSKNYDRRWLCRWSQIRLLKPNPCCIIWSKQQKALASTWMQIKQGSCVLDKKSHLLFKYLGNNISSAESNINIRRAKAWNPIDRLLIISKSDLFDKIKQDFSQTVAVSIPHGR